MSNAVAGIVEKVEQGIKAIAGHIRDAFVVLFGAAEAKQFAQSAEALLKSAFGPVVVKIVSDLNLTTLTNEQKRAQAVADVGAAAKAAGKTLGESLINLLVELAVSEVKGNLGALAAL